MVVTHTDKLGEAPRLERKVVLWPPGPVLMAAFQAPPLARVKQPEASGGVLLVAPAREPQRFEKIVSETDVGQPRLFKIDAQGEMIKFLARHSLFVDDTGGEQRNPKSKRREQRSESAVELVAEATAATGDNLLQEALGIEHNLAAEADIEIFERNGQQVLAVQHAQRIGIRR